MKLKTLLLGSAAAMIAVTGARAADAVIADPEPVEYVRVCDMYGAGFFYIPGTETCLSIGGYVRVDYTFNDSDNTADTDTWDYRARLNFDARNETDYGTLRSQIRLQADGNANVVRGVSTNFTGNAAGNPVTSGEVGFGDGPVGIDRALIELAGFRLGYSDSFTTTWHGYGLPVEKYDGPYGYDQAVFFDYTYSANGFAAGVGVQDSTANNENDLQGAVAAGPAAGVLIADAADNTINADIYAGLKYGGSWGEVAGSYIYETDVEEGAWKFSATLTLIENMTIKGFYVGDEDGTTRQVQGAGDYAWGIGAAYNFSPEFRIHAGYADTDVNDTAFGVVGAIWNPVPGLSIRPEARFGEDDVNSYSVRVYRNF